jgi:hypothetical protein
MEHIRRENLLFESYLIRNSKDLPKEVLKIRTNSKRKKLKIKNLRKRKIKKRKKNYLPTKKNSI